MNSEITEHRFFMLLTATLSLTSQVLTSARLEERIRLCRPSLDLPDWWVCGKHDRELLMGAARHGLGRTDFYYVHDPELSFREILRRHYAGEPLLYPQVRRFFYRVFVVLLSLPSSS